MALLGLPLTWPFVEFAWPWWAVLAACAAVAAPVVWLWKHSRVPGSAFRRRMSLALRLALMLGLVLAMAQTRIIRNNHGVCVVFVLDQSDSIPQATRDALRAQLAEDVKQMKKDDQFAIVEFGADAVLECLPGPKGPLPAAVKVNNSGQTDISRALRLALASFPPDRQKRIVLLSDGNQNAGDAIKEARVAAANDVDVEVMLLNPPSGREVIVEQLELPTRVQKDTVFEGRVIISSDQAQMARLLVFRDGRQLEAKRISLQAGTNVIPLPDKISEGGFHQFQVTVQPEGGPEADTFAANNSAYGFTQVDAPGKVLIVRGKADEDDFIGQALRANGIETVTAVPDGVPTQNKDLMAYDCVVLENVNRWDLMGSRMGALARWVKDFGGGVVMVGGDNSFGPGGYKGTPLEDISPVDMDVKRKKHLASVAMVIMLDKSGSMGMPVKGGVVGGGGGTLCKMDLANQGAVETLKLLGPSDEAMIGSVDTEVRWMAGHGNLLTMTDANKTMLRTNTLANRAGGGGIFAKTALVHAYNAITAPSVRAMARHVILFADCNDTEQQDDCIALAARYAKSTPTVTTTVIGLGEKSDSDVAFQKRVAEVGGGRAYITNDAMALPRFFAKEAFIAARSAFVEKNEGITAHLFQSPLLDGLEKGVPKVYGYVGTTIKPRATLAAYGLEPDDPLLAHWVTGLGKAVAYTSDATNRWGKDWVQWGLFNRFWAQTVRWASRSMRDQRLSTKVTIEGQEGRVVVEAVDNDGKPINNLRLRTNVAPPDDSAQTIPTPLVQVAPGRYEGRFPARQRGTYLAPVVDQVSGQAASVGAAVMSYPPEFRDLAPNAGVLKAIAEATGGREIRDFEGVFEPKTNVVLTFWPLWPHLLAAAAFLLLLDVAWRRLNVADWLGRKLPELAEAMQGAAQRAGAGLATAANGTGGGAVGALKTVRSSRQEVAEQTESLRERVAAVAESREPTGGEGQSPLAGIAGSGVRQEAPVSTTRAKREEGGGDYRSRLMGAKKRAVEQIEEKKKETE